MINDFDSPLDLFELNFPVMAFIYAFTVWLMRRMTLSTKNYINTLVIALSCFAIASLLSALWQSSANFSQLWGEPVDLRIIGLILGYVLGDFNGILLIFPLILSFLIRDKTTKFKFNSVTPAFIGILATSMILSYFIQVIEPQSLTYIKLLFFILMIYVAVQYSGIAVVITTWSIIVALSVYNTSLKSSNSALEEQVYIIILAITGAMLSAFIFESKKFINRLEKQNKMLTINKAKLKRELTRNQTLAKNIVHKQELERIRIARDLHDEVGQNITALKTNIEVMDKINENDEIKSIITNVTQLTNKVYDTSHDIMYRLRPVTLNQLGLAKSLKTDAFSRSLRTGNIEYELDIQGDIDTVSEPIQSATYRIIQETISNTIKYAQASYFRVVIKEEGTTFCCIYETMVLGLI